MQRYLGCEVSDEEFAAAEDAYEHAACSDDEFLREWRLCGNGPIVRGLVDRVRELEDRLTCRW